MAPDVVVPLDKAKTVEVKRSPRDPLTVPLADLRQECMGADGKMDPDERLVFDALQEMDVDGDGTIGVLEIVKIAQSHLNQSKKIKDLRKALIVGFIAFTVIIALLLTSSILANELTKDTRPQDDGTMKTVSGKNVKVGAVPTEQEPLSSTLPDAAFRELKTFAAKSDNGSYIEVAIDGFMRVMRSQMPGTSYVKLITGHGTIKLEGTTLVFDDLVGTLFQEAGFTLDHTGRRILGLYELIGFFNAVERDQWTGIALEAGDILPGIFQDAIMEFTMRYPCEYDRVNMCTATEGGTATVDMSAPLDMTQFIASAADVTTLGSGFAEISYLAQFDFDTNAIMEQVTNKEFPQYSLFKYQTPDGDMQKTLFENQFYYCSNGISQAGMAAGTDDNEDLTAEEKAEMESMKREMESEVLSTIQKDEAIAKNSKGEEFTMREFEMKLTLSEVQYILLMNDMDASGYETTGGELTVRWFDDKDTGKPVKIVYSTGHEIVFKSFEYSPVVLSVETFQYPATCIESSEDVHKFPGDPFAINYQSRADRKAFTVESLMTVEEQNTARALADAAAAAAGRRLLSANEMMDYDMYGLDGPQNLSAEHPAFVHEYGNVPATGRHLQQINGADMPYGTWRMYQDLCIDASGSSYGSCQSSAITQVKEFSAWILTVEIESWEKPCGLKRLTMGASCFAPGFNCYGYCEGGTPLLCGYAQNEYSLECGIGIKFDALDLMGTPVKKAIEKMKKKGGNAAAEIGFELFYRFPNMVGVRGYGNIGAIVAFGRRGRWKVGVWLSFEALGLITLRKSNSGGQDSTIQLKFSFTGSLCLMFCISFCVTPFDKTFNIGRRHMLDFHGPLAHHHDPSDDYDLMDIPGAPQPKDIVIEDYAGWRHP